MNPYPFKNKLHFGLLSKTLKIILIFFGQINGSAQQNKCFLRKSIRKLQKLAKVLTKNKLFILNCRLAPDLRFMCQTSSIDFLISNDFDFNKLFKDGIPYLRPGDEARLRETISDRQESRRSTGKL